MLVPAAAVVAPSCRAGIVELAAAAELVELDAAARRCAAAVDECGVAMPGNPRSAASIRWQDVYGGPCPCSAAVRRPILGLARRTDRVQALLMCFLGRRVVCGREHEHERDG